jgi:hypothetical protein
MMAVSVQVHITTLLTLAASHHLSRSRQQHRVGQVGVAILACAESALSPAHSASRLVVVLYQPVEHL